MIPGCKCINAWQSLIWPYPWNCLTISSFFSVALFERRQWRKQVAFLHLCIKHQALTFLCFLTETSAFKDYSGCTRFKIRLYTIISQQPHVLIGYNLKNPMEELGWAIMHDLRKSIANICWACNVSRHGSTLTTAKINSKFILKIKYGIKISTIYLISW